jgi:hypothetical protein
VFSGLLSSSAQRDVCSGLLSGAQRDVCFDFLSSAQHDVLVSSTSCSQSSSRLKILQGTNKGSCTLWSRLGREERHWSASKGAKPEVL